MSNRYKNIMNLLYANGVSDKQFKRYFGIEKINEEAIQKIDIKKIENLFHISKEILDSNDMNKPKDEEKDYTNAPFENNDGEKKDGLDFRNAKRFNPLRKAKVEKNFDDIPTYSEITQSAKSLPVYDKSLNFDVEVPRNHIITDTTLIKSEYDFWYFYQNEKRNLAIMPIQNHSKLLINATDELVDHTMVLVRHEDYGMAIMDVRLTDSGNDFVLTSLDVPELSKTFLSDIEKDEKHLGFRIYGIVRDVDNYLE